MKYNSGNNAHKKKEKKIQPGTFKEGEDCQLLMKLTE